MENKIEARHLNLYYGQKHALKDVSLDIKENKITAFIGPSGCGKSTFLKTLNRMNDYVDNVKIEGDVILDGEDIYDSRVDTTLLRKKVGMVFQQPNPFPMSIYDNVAYGPRIHGIKNKKQLDKIVEDSLKAAALYDEVSDRLHSSALDPISTLKIEELLLQLKDQYTIAIVTHNMQQASRIADYTAFFLVGEMVEYGPTKDVFGMPKDKRTEDYITGRFG